MLDLNNLRICFVAGTLGQGGAEQQLLYQLQALVEQGAQVCVACLSRNEYWEPAIRQLGIPVHWIGASLRRPQRLASLIRVAQRFRPQFVQCAHFYTNLYGAAAARAIGAREIGALRNDGTYDLMGLSRPGGQMSLRLPRIVAANSTVAIRHARRLGVPARRLFFLPNVVNTDHFQPPAARASRDGVHIAAAGRLVPVKRFDRFLRVISRVRQNSSICLRVSIAGDGPEREDLVRLATELGLYPGAVTLLGAVTNMAAFYQTADIFVLTSDHEGTPNVVVEAMASGLPVVATPAGDVPELIRHGETGFVVAAGDEELMAQALADLAANLGMRTTMGERGRQAIEHSRSLSQLPGMLSRLYAAASQ